MSALKDLVDLITELKDADITLKSASDRVRGATSGAKSVSVMARQNVCQFPLLTSSSVSVSAYSKVSKILENLYANYLRIVIMNSAEIIDLTKNDDKAKLLKRVHQNDDTLSQNVVLTNDTQNELVDLVGTITSESFNYNLFGTNGIFTDRILTESDIKEACKELLKPYDKNFSLTSLNGNNELLTEAKEEPVVMLNPGSFALLQYAKAKEMVSKNPKAKDSTLYKELISKAKASMELYQKMKKIDSFSSEARKRINVKELVANESVDNDYNYYSYLLKEDEQIEVDEEEDKKERHLRARLEQLEQELDDIQSDITSLESDIHTKEVIIEDIKGEISELEKQRASINPNRKNKKQLDDYNIKIDQKQREIDQYNAEIETLTARIITKKNNKNKLLDEYIKVRKEVSRAIEFNQKRKDAMEKANADSKAKRDIEDKEKEAREANAYYSNVGDVQSVDTKIKKANSLEPSLLKLDVNYMTPSGYLNSTRMVVGVKCVTHLIDFTELAYFLPQALVKKNLLFRFIQWTSGEIKFMKDFVLDLDTVKFQATSDKKSVKWWRHLESRRKASKLSKLMSGKYSFVPNATIILSKEDVEFIKIKDNVDFFKDTSAVSKLMDIYFLMHMVIVDEVEEMMYIFNSDTKQWDSQRYTRDPEDSEMSMLFNNSFSR